MDSICMKMVPSYPYQESPPGISASVFAAGSDIYVAGSDSVGDAVYWKNRQMHVVEQGYYPNHSSGSGSFRFCLFVSRNRCILVEVLNASDTAGYWKNGLATPVFRSTSINSLFVSGSDLYFTGYVLNCLQMVEPMPLLIRKNGVVVIYSLMALLMETPLPFSYRGLMYM